MILDTIFGDILTISHKMNQKNFSMTSFSSDLAKNSTKQDLGEGGSALKRGKHSRPRGPLCSVVVGHAFCTVGPA